MSVDVHWRMTNRDDEDFSHATAQQVTILGGAWPALSVNAEHVAAVVLEDYFGEHGNWEVWVGGEAERATMRVRISRPPTIAGEYLVDLKQVVKGTAKRVSLAEAA